MGERLDTDSQYSRRLPPPEAWKKPDKWIDLSTGLAKQDRSKLVLPIDDRGFVKTDTAVEVIKDTFFWNDYDWPFTPGDVETEPDDHHFYYDETEYEPDNFDGSMIPRRFRGLPTHIGRMPRQFHNALHDFTVKPEMPELDDMAHYLTSYTIALEAFKRLYKTAKNTIDAEQKFLSRKRSLATGMVRPRTPDDAATQGFMRTFFDNHFQSYAEAVEQFKQTDHRELVSEEFRAFEVARRKRIAQKAGRVIARQHINYTPLIRGQRPKDERSLIA